jgi:S-adenosylmethionine-dependent methyltransferase
VKLSRILSVIKGKSAGHGQPTVPGHLSAQFRQISDSGLDAVRASLEQHYFAFPRKPRDYLATERGQQDIQDHLVHRLRRDRQQVIPWLEDNRPLGGCRVLEIGCGTGCSTVALAEQGAKVIGIDLDEPSLEVAKRRCEIYNLDVEFRLGNAVEVGELFRGIRFDFIIFYASLEHMCHEERIRSIRASWDMLPPGGLWCVIETPNRLWHTDHHTSLLPFFHWLPDELAFHCSRFSPRTNFREIYDDYDDEQQRLHFLRRGRGVSFHEFALAIGPVEQLNVLSSLAMHLTGRTREAWLKRHSWLGRTPPTPTLDDRYRALLAEVYPSIHPGFFERDLDLILLKTE